MDEPDDDTCLALATLHGAEFVAAFWWDAHKHFKTGFALNIYDAPNLNLMSVPSGMQDSCFAAETKAEAARKYCRHHGLFA